MLRYLLSACGGALARQKMAMAAASGISRHQNNSGIAPGAAAAAAAGRRAQRLRAWRWQALGRRARGAVTSNWLFCSLRVFQWRLFGQHANIMNVNSTNFSETVFLLSSVEYIRDVLAGEQWTSVWRRALAA